MHCWCVLVRLVFVCVCMCAPTVSWCVQLHLWLQSVQLNHHRAGQIRHAAIERARAFPEQAVVRNVNANTATATTTATISVAVLAVVVLAVGRRGSRTEHKLACLTCPQVRRDKVGKCACLHRQDLAAHAAGSSRPTAAIEKRFHAAVGAGAQGEAQSSIWRDRRQTLTSFKPACENQRCNFTSSPHIHMCLTPSLLALLYVLSQAQFPSTTDPNKFVCLRLGCVFGLGRFKPVDCQLVSTELDSCAMI